MKLFKLFSVSALLIGAIATSTAQDNGSNSESMAISFGIKGGANFANINGGDSGDPDSRTSFFAGALAEFPVASIFSIQVEALYSGQGAKADFRGPDGDKAELQLDYINVPVLAKFYLFKGFSLEAGPQFGFLVRHKFDLNPNSGSGDVNLNGDNFNKFDFGVAGGLTFQTDMGLFATARYTQGMSDVIKDANIKNNVFQVGIGYKF